ncbi:MAG: hypothetical protein GY757_02110, partial [bacterium]|nr:hypothetical protein [bacterium]
NSLIIVGLALILVVLAKSLKINLKKPLLFGFSFFFSYWVLINYIYHDSFWHVVNTDTIGTVNAMYYYLLLVPIISILFLFSLAILKKFRHKVVSALLFFTVNFIVVNNLPILYMRNRIVYYRDYDIDTGFFMHDNILTLLREYPDIFWIRPLAYLIAIFAIFLIPYAAWKIFKKIKSGSHEEKTRKSPLSVFSQKIADFSHSLKAPGFLRASLFFILFIVLTGFSLDWFINVRDIDRMLSEAVGKGNLAEVKELVKKGANINVRYHAKTLLQHAADKGVPSVLSFLAEKGLDIDAKDHHGDTPLLHIVRDDRKSPSKRYEIAALLIKKGADVNVKDTWNDASALHWAVFHNHKELVELLIVNGANPDSKIEKDLDGSLARNFPTNTSPLDIAVKKGDSDIVEFLIRNGAQVDSIDTLGELVDFAAVNGLTDIAEMLKKAVVKTGRIYKPKN